MQTRWTKGLDKQEETDLRAQLVAATGVLKRLGVLLEEDLQRSHKTQESVELYNSPSWAYHQADSIGEQRAYKKILRLINQKEA